MKQSPKEQQKRKWLKHLNLNVYESQIFQKHLQSFKRDLIILELYKTKEENNNSNNKQ